MQIYLLTVLSSLLGGLCLSRQLLSEKFEGFKPFAELLGNSMFHLILGIVAVLSGIFSLFTFSPNDLVIIGDLLPSVACLTVGAFLISEFASQDDATGFIATLAKFSREKGALVGIAAMGIGLLHAIIPLALFL
ncbi:MAG: hypothetical protein PF447_14975 [Spirochaetaceae bacterium]|nr:hypothetical protein [Spirochaetaceae bacterium]